MGTPSAHQAPAQDASAETAAPHLPLLHLFAKFLNFGIHAWGGPAAQIAMIRTDLVEREHWVSSARFNRALAVYQVLPGPEAHELCCYFGYLSRGRIGALAAGLGFMLPGLLLMLALSWVYVRFGIASPLVVAAFAGVKPAVAALIVRAVHRIGSHALHRDPWLWIIAIVSTAATLLGVHFAVVLALGGIAYAATGKAGNFIAAAGIALLIAITIWLTINSPPDSSQFQPIRSAQSAPASAPAQSTGEVPPAALLLSGLKAGMLTFGGAYTAIPFVRNDAVTQNRWLTDAQFLDGIGLSGVLPAPLVIFGTFVGFLAGSWIGAFAMTLGIFTPAFAFTIIGHGVFERVVANVRVHRLLDGVTAAVVGLIAATAIQVSITSVTSVLTAAIFLAALVALFLTKSKWVTPAVIGAAAVASMFAHAVTSPA